MLHTGRLSVRFLTSPLDFSRYQIFRTHYGLRHYATSWKVKDLISDEPTRFFNLPNFPAALWPCGRFSI
jgi:hypothetical protein